MKLSQVQKVDPKLQVQFKQNSDRAEEKKNSGYGLPLISMKKTIHSSLKKLKIRPFLSNYVKLLSQKGYSHRLSTDMRRSTLLIQNEDLRNRISASGFKSEITSPHCNENIIPQLIWQRTTKESFYKQNFSGMIPFSLSPKLIFETQDDEFYYINILKSPTFTSFYNILDCQFDTLNHPFPYCGKFSKFSRKKYSPMKKRFTGVSFKLHHICTCPKPGFIEETPYLFSINEIRQNLSGLSRLYYHPRNVLHSKNLVILNFEETLGVYKCEAVVCLSTWRLLKLISDNFQLIVVTNQDTSKNLEILEYFDSENVKLAGLYEEQLPLSCSKELSKLQDYSQIFTDFNCKSTKESCLIVSSHYLAEDECDDCQICILKGITYKLTTTKIPVASQDYPKAPALFLLPNFDAYYKKKCLNQILKSLISFALSSSTLNFFTLFNQTPFKISQSDKIYKLLIHELTLLSFSSGSTGEFFNSRYIGSPCRIHCSQNRPSGVINYFITLNK